jgi:hypothetical protein
MVRDRRKYAFNSPKYVFIKLLKCHRLSKITGHNRRTNPLPCLLIHRHTGESLPHRAPTALTPTANSFETLSLPHPIPQDGEHEPELPRATIDVQHEFPSEKNHRLLFLPRHPPPERRQGWCRYFPIVSTQGGGGVGGVLGRHCPRRIRSQSTCRGWSGAYAGMTAGQQRSCSRRPSHSMNGDASPPNTRPLASSRRKCSSSSGHRWFGHLNCVFCSSILNKMLSEHRKKFLSLKPVFKSVLNRCRKMMWSIPGPQIKTRKTFLYWTKLEY